PGQLEAVERALAVDPGLPAAARTWISGYQARELAMAGDDAGSGRAVETAVAAAALAAGEDPGWGLWSQHAELAGLADRFIRMRELNLGHYAQALDSYESALRNAAGAPWWVVDRRLAVVDASIGLDDPERACAEAAAAFELARRHGLGSRVSDVLFTRARFPERWAPLSCVAALDQRLRM
ncbi:MAG: hypothetical protein ACREMR_09000, partial [Gemmatimonadales bacterium]